MQIGIILASESLNKFLKAQSDMDASYIGMLMLQYNKSVKEAKLKAASKTGKLKVVESD